MPAPVNSDELLNLVLKSGVVEEPKLRAYLKKLRESTGIPADTAKLAGLLVRDAILTYFQAEQLLQGKYKRFTIGKYRVLEKLGSGGMGQVFLCEHKLMRRRVAVKVLPAAKADDPSSLERFYREARAVAALDHPNIVRAYDIDQDENLHFLVMEYVDGTNLQDLVKRAGPLDVLRACHYIYGSAIGLQHAHENGLVHRDIKPGNILVDRAGVVKILDMGLARFFHDDDDNLTRNYDENVLGTADYLAPEQALDSHTVDIRADIYSLGATFYYLLTGSSPFPEGSVAQKLIWHQNRQPRSLKSLRSDVPDALLAVIERMMVKDPAERFQTPAEVIAALAGWVATPIPPPSEREMPNISPAAGGSSRAPATATGLGFRLSGAESPTVIAPSAPIVTPPPLGPLSDVTTPGPAVWESLDTDTQTLALGDTDRASPGRSRRPVREPAGPDRRRALKIGGAAIAAAGLAVAGYFAFIREARHAPEPVNPGNPPSRRITVSKSGGENAVPTLREAISKAMPGDTIVIAEPHLTEVKLRIDPVKHRDLTIESATADGKPAVIDLAGTGTAGILLEATGVDGFTLRNVELDGGGRTEIGILIAGVAPGTLLENVTVRGVKTAGIKLSNAAGDTTRPIRIEQCRMQLTGPTQDGLWIFSANVESHHVVIRNSRFEGTGTGTGIRIQGASADLDISENRFFNLDNAIAFKQPASGMHLRAAITSNTIYQVKAGVVVDVTPVKKEDPPAGKYDLAIERNYFARTTVIGKVIGGAGKIPGVNTRDNAGGPDNGAANATLPVVALPTPLVQSVSPTEDDSKFLRFAAGQPVLGPMKVKVGAP